MYGGKKLRLTMDKQKTDIDLLSPLILAYIGDAAYELWVRKYLVAQGLTKVNTLHHQAVKYVNAETQSRLVSKLEKILTQEEVAILKRGRNAKSGRQPKSMDMIAYRRATGLEALVGYLYLLGREERLCDIFTVLIQMVEEENGISRPDNDNHDTL